MPKRWFTRRGGERSQPLAGDALERSGLLAALSPEHAALVRDAFARGTPLITAIEPLGWRADGEDLAEGDVETLLRSMAPAVERAGVPLDVESVRRPLDGGRDGYAIRINGEVVELYEFDPEDPTVPSDPDPWMACTLEPLARVNELLAGVGASHRVVVFRPGANDGLVCLLPLEAIELLRTADLLDEEDRPVTPGAP